MLLVVDPDFFRLLCDSVTFCAVIVLLPCLSHARNHVSCRFLIFWTSGSSCCDILRTVSFLTLCLLVTHNSPLNQAISAPRTHFDHLLSNTLILFEMLCDFHILLSLSTIAGAQPILLFMSFVHFPSSIRTVRLQTFLAHLLPRL